jgi:hypothetical protein
MRTTATTARRRRRYVKEHRGTVILVLGILGIVLGCPFGLIMGPIAWSMANADLPEIRAGRMDPAGEGTTNAGRICGIIATILNGIGAVCCVGYVLFLIIVGPRAVSSNRTPERPAVDGRPEASHALAAEVPRAPGCCRPRRPPWQEGQVPRLRCHLDVQETPPEPPPPPQEETVNLPLKSRWTTPAAPVPSPPLATPRSVSSSPSPPPASSAAADEDLQACPHCGERIRKILQRCPYCEEPIRKSRRVRDELEAEEEDERPYRRRRRFARYDGEPHRGPMVLVFGIISIVFSVFACCGVPDVCRPRRAGPGHSGLDNRPARPAEDVRGRDGPHGRGQTQSGMICVLSGPASPGRLADRVAILVIYVVAMIVAGASGAAR